MIEFFKSLSYPEVGIVVLSIAGMYIFFQVFYDVLKVIKDSKDEDAEDRQLFEVLGEKETEEINKKVNENLIVFITYGNLIALRNEGYGHPEFPIIEKEESEAMNWDVKTLTLLGYVSRVKSRLIEVASNSVGRRISFIPISNVEAELLAFEYRWEKKEPLVHIKYENLKPFVNIDIPLKIVRFTYNPYEKFNKEEDAK